MKVVAVLGSPHPDGPSSTIAKEVIRGAKDAGHEVVIYQIDDIDFKGCRDCGYCKQHDADCILDDGLKPYWKDLHECGALIVSAPNYASNVRGDMITYMNRHYCLFTIKDGNFTLRIHPGIKLVGIFSQGNSDPEAYMDNYKWFLGDFQNRAMELQDILVHTGGMPLDPDSEIMTKAYKLGKEL